MGKRVRKVITIELHEVWSVRGGGVRTGWCPVCRAMTPMLAPAEAATLAGIDTRQLYRRVESGVVHLTESPQEGPRVCQNSLNVHSGS